ncbi:MAG: cupin domain-containing protein [Bifidobacteriaceae bacterium]|nr:cupin domain-containing protein [Bifidobacteriaceae bacterium]
MPPLSDDARDTIARLGLEPHPEGGWFHRDWQSESVAQEESRDARPLSSLIYFLLPAGDFSEWHKVDADEIWLWHGPAQVKIGFGGTGETPELDTVYNLGSKTTPGHVVVPKGVWQRTLPTDGDALVSCVVSPGFVFSGFTLE